MPTKMKFYGTLCLKKQKSWTGAWTFTNVPPSFSAQTPTDLKVIFKVEYSYSHFFSFILKAIE